MKVFACDPPIRVPVPLLPLMAACYLAGQTVAPAATLIASSEDGEVRSNGTFETTSYQARVGEYYYPGGSSFVMPFLLPSLPAGQGFGTADLRFQLYGKTEVFPPTVGVDLYGLNRRALDTLLSGDYYSSATIDPAAALIGEDVVTPAMGLAVYNTSGATNTALVNYLNAQYADGAGAGQYVFLRFSYAGDVPLTDTAYYFLTQNASGETERPVLTYTTTAIPEAETIAFLAGTIGLAFLLRKRGSTS